MGLRSCTTITLRRALFLCLVCILILTYALLVAYIDGKEPVLDVYSLRAVGGPILIARTKDALHSHTVKMVPETRHFPTPNPLAAYDGDAGKYHEKIAENASTPKQSCFPVNTRLYPFCRDKFQYVKVMWRSKCFKNFHGVDGSDCSVMKYLTEQEPFCWHNSSYIVKQLKRHQSDIVHFNSDLDGLLGILSDELFRWLRMRITQMWPSWTETIKELKSNPTVARRDKKKVMFFMGSMGFQPHFLKFAGLGGPVGELVQWTDAIASTYILGHDVSVVYNSSQLSKYMKGSRGGCVPKDSLNDLSDYDAIFTDLNGFSYIKVILGSAVVAHYRCKLRFLDSFGTEPEFNFGGYTLPIPGGASHWGHMDVQLQQIMTMYPHSPDNSFLGFVVGNVEREQLPKKKNKAVVYGKLGRYFEGHKAYLDVVNEFFEVHATAAGSLKDVPSYVVSHGVLDGKSLTKLLQESKVFIGLGFPYEGPGPLDAIANGVAYINPKFTPPRNRINDPFFKDKPTLRKVTSQNPYMEEFVREPYTYTVDIGDFNELRKILKKIQQQNDLKPFIPKEYTNTGMAERVHAFLEHQDFCDEHAAPWPPESSRQLHVSPEGLSCKELCLSKGLVCEPSFFYRLNNVEELRSQGFDCMEVVTSQQLHAPSFNAFNQTCHLQVHSMLFSCVAESRDHQRLCPCRDFIKEQTALCRDCL